MIKHKYNTLKRFQITSEQCRYGLVLNINDFQSERKGKCLSIEFNDLHIYCGMVSIMGFSKETIMLPKGESNVIWFDL